MSKKQRRRVPQNLESVTVKPSPTVKSERATGIYEFKPDYTYIIKDLKKIGILAGSFFAILIILSLILK